jgi:hypothetical protein
VTPLVILGYVALMGWLVALGCWCELRASQRHAQRAMAMLATINASWRETCEVVRWAERWRRDAADEADLVIVDTDRAERVH